MVSFVDSSIWCLLLFVLILDTLPAMEDGVACSFTMSFNIPMTLKAGRLAGIGKLRIMQALHFLPILLLGWFWIKQSFVSSFLPSD